MIPLIDVGEWNLGIMTLVYVGLMLATVWGVVDQALQGRQRRRKQRRQQAAEKREDR